ncbi:MAG: ATP-dependent zinc metalloprotease FtsH [Termitinemataceae bacterium]|jgi:cell division protease FtsH|nr:MAG: ATP-dependent zinc metalloprotease FtsH [Termitinemataceae bacterium]
MKKKFARPPQPEGSPRFGLFFALTAIVIVIFMYFRAPQARITDMPYSDFVNIVKDSSRRPASVIIFDDSTIEWHGAGKDEYFMTIIPYQDTNLLTLLESNNVRISGEKRPVSWLNIILRFLPWVFGFFLIVMFFRSMQYNAPGGRGFTFGKSRAKLYDQRGEKITFESVAGQKDAKAELEEIVAFLKDPEKFTRMGARIPKGVLLVGMPGTGKTLMARAVAGEAEVAFFHISGSDFVEMFVGVGASRVRDLFEEGRRNRPCIIFIDELDAVGRTRGAGLGGGHDEREQTLNQMLVEMDGFDTKEGIIILAATNRPDVLDPALLRPGRFDRQVMVAMPDINERREMLKIHGEKIKFDSDVDFDRIARATPGMSGADIANLVNEAALLAARKDRKAAIMEDFEAARDKILMGVARSTLAISEKERRMTAVHESGHALLHYFLPNSDPLHKVTIVPHGRALGMAISLPEEDSYSRRRKWIEDRIVICYGGWTAETLVYNETTTGAKADIAQATEMARNMVCEWGMSGELGPIAFGEDDEPIFIGKQIARHKEYSEETARVIDAAIKQILDDCLNRAKQILGEQRGRLDMLTNALLERETLSDAEVRSLLDIKPV